MFQAQKEKQGQKDGEQIDKSPSLWSTRLTDRPADSGVMFRIIYMFMAICVLTSAMQR